MIQWKNVAQPKATFGAAAAENESFAMLQDLQRWQIVFVFA